MKGGRGWREAGRPGQRLRGKERKRLRGQSGEAGEPQPRRERTGSEDLGLHDSAARSARVMVRLCSALPVLASGGMASLPCLPLHGAPTAPGPSPGAPPDPLAPQPQACSSPRRALLRAPLLFLGTWVSCNSAFFFAFMLFGVGSFTGPSSMTWMPSLAHGGGPADNC